ncbi:MAG: radical SAM protein [Peptostreptococcaceae bacterium]|nr:radical SAM protein [Peptostreptococcaceae bacterium]
METYVIHVTKACNCDCVYCYEKDKKSQYTWSEVQAFIDRLIEHRTEDDFCIEFLGGEPMLAFDLIRKSYEYIEGKKEIHVPNYVITTNGTIMNEEIAEYLSKNPKIRFAASLDGHIYANQLRVFKESRKNTYDKVIENIRMLRTYGIEASIHMVTHPYNVAMIADSIDILYEEGIRSIGLGTVESTMTIDEAYCERFIQECDEVSKKICSGIYKDLHISEFEWVKPISDVRSYIRDESGKVIGESYGRSGKDITHAKDYAVTRCIEQDQVSAMIHHIRKTIYDNHQKRKGGTR